jgi:hypothetical protein
MYQYFPAASPCVKAMAWNGLLIDEVGVIAIYVIQ